MYLLDTNTVIYYLNNSLPSTAMQQLSNIVDTSSYLSVITKMEVLGFQFPSAAQQQIAEAFIEGSTVLPINDSIVNETIAIRKTKRSKLPDAIIAAPALVYGYTLLSRNVSDFKDFAGITVVDPFGW